jgi:multiple antibiotic resistance protein
MELSNFWLCFVPLFVAVDAIGVLPIFISLTDGIEKKQRFKIVSSSIITATVVGLLFLFVGEGTQELK